MWWTLDYFPIVAFIVAANCSGVIFFRKILVEVGQHGVTLRRVRAWSQDSVKFGASLAMP